MEQYEQLLRESSELNQFGENQSKESLTKSIPETRLSFGQWKEDSKEKIDAKRRSNPETRLSLHKSNEKVHNTTMRKSDKQTRLSFGIVEKEESSDKKKNAVVDTRLSFGLWRIDDEDESFESSNSKMRSDSWTRLSIRSINKKIDEEKQN